MSQTKIVDKIEKHIFFSKGFFFSKIVPYVGKCGKIL